MSRVSFLLKATVVTSAGTGVSSVVPPPRRGCDPSARLLSTDSELEVTIRGCCIVSACDVSMAVMPLLSILADMASEATVTGGPEPCTDKDWVFFSSLPIFLPPRGLELSLLLVTSNEEAVFKLLPVACNSSMESQNSIVREDNFRILLPRPPMESSSPSSSSSSSPLLIGGMAGGSTDK